MVGRPRAVAKSSPRADVCDATLSGDRPLRKRVVKRRDLDCENKGSAEVLSPGPADSDRNGESEHSLKPLLREVKFAKTMGYDPSPDRNRPRAFTTKLRPTLKAEAAINPKQRKELPQKANCNGAA